MFCKAGICCSGHAGIGSSLVRAVPRHHRPGWAANGADVIHSDLIGNEPTASDDRGCQVETFYFDSPSHVVVSCHREPVEGYTCSMLPVWEVLALLGLGFCAGMLGGLIGIGGGVITIPALTFLLGRDIHLAQAASMNVVAFVAIPASIRHWKQGELEIGLLRYVVPFGVAGIILGVLTNNMTSPELMGIFFGVFLLYVILMNILRLCTPRLEPKSGSTVISLSRGGMIGSAAGFGGGLLGVGGGLITVPLSQKLCRLTLPHAIAVSSGLMCFTSVIGAIAKDVTITSIHDSSGKSLQLLDALQIAMWLFPMAMLGAWMGARLTHLVPVKWIRIVFISVLLIAAWKYLSKPIQDLFTMLTQLV